MSFWRAELFQAVIGISSAESAVYQLSMRYTCGYSNIENYYYLRSLLIVIE